MSVFNEIRQMMIRDKVNTSGTVLKYKDENGNGIKMDLGGVSPDLSPKSLKETALLKGADLKTTGILTEETKGIDGGTIKGELTGPYIDKLLGITPDIPTVDTDVPPTE